MPVALSHIQETDRLSVLLGPASLEWSPSLERLLAPSCVVERSASRDGFLRHIRHAAPRVIVLFDTDERGTPNEPLLRHCARYCPSSDVIYVHPGPAMRLPSSWSIAPRRIRFVMLAGQSPHQDAILIAEQVADAIAEQPSAPRA